MGSNWRLEGYDGRFTKRARITGEGVQVLPLKSTFALAIFIFELGSLICGRFLILLLVPFGWRSAVS